MRPIHALTLPCLFSTACAIPPEVFPVPPQRAPLVHEVLGRDVPLLDMGDPEAETAFVSDIARGPQFAPWRWTGPHPQVKVMLNRTADLRFRMDFTIVQYTFKDTGPVTITFLVNGQVLDRVRYSTTGSRVFLKPVPETMLHANSENTLGAEVDKPWVTASGMKLGVILQKIGLERAR